MPLIIQCLSHYMVYKLSKIEPQTKLWYVDFLNTYPKTDSNWGLDVGELSETVPRQDRSHDGFQLS